MKKRQGLMEEDMKSEFDPGKYHGFDLIDDGRYVDSAVLKYRETFSLKKLLCRAGKNYVFDAGKLISDQIKPEEKEAKDRRGGALPPPPASLPISFAL